MRALLDGNLARMPFVTQLRADLTSAMKSGDLTRVRVIRGLLGAIANAGSVPDDGQIDSGVGLYRGEGERRELSTADIRAVVLSELEERDEAIALVTGTGAEVGIEEERSIVAGYLEAIS